MKLALITCARRGSRKGIPLADHNHGEGCAACSDLLARESAARAAAEAANQAKDDFFLTLSHELRGPLNAISTWVHILRTEGLEQDIVTRAIDTIERNVKAQARLIGDMFEVSRAIGGKIALKRCPTELAGLIQESVDSVRPAAGDREIQVRTQTAPHPISVDPERMRQVVENLLLNAMKFTPLGGRIAVNLGYDAESATIAVSDTGMGIRPDVLPHIFERFWQSATPRFGGLGLGLTIVQHIVGLHGGTVTASSEGEGHGATFTVTLPTHAGPRSAGPGLA